MHFGYYKLKKIYRFADNAKGKTIGIQAIRGKIVVKEESPGLAKLRSIINSPHYNVNLFVIVHRRDETY